MPTSRMHSGTVPEIPHPIVFEVSGLSTSILAIAIQPGRSVLSMRGQLAFGIAARIAVSAPEG
jgi:hypothetical protein